MAYLKNSARLALQAQWLACWREAGCPVLPQRSGMGQYSVSAFPPFRVSALERVVQLYGLASRMKIWLGDVDVTALVAALAGYRLCKGETVIRRSGSGEAVDRAALRQSAINVHLAAAESHLDIEAYRATGLLLPPAMEARLLDARLAGPPISSNGAAAL
jgi:hypothetical protein